MQRLGGPPLAIFLTCRYLAQQRQQAAEFVEWLQEAGLEALQSARSLEMNTTWRTIVWQQFGAAIDMLGNALRACPEQLWRDSIWDDPTDAPEYTEFWFIVYHALFWTDLYLSGSREGFALPAPFVAGSLPAKPYTKGELEAYLEHCRRKCRTTFETLTDEKANQSCQFPWGEEVSFAELQLYSMRHVQEHAAQLSLHLGQKAGSAPDWVARAESKAA